MTPAYKYVEPWSKYTLSQRLRSVMRGKVKIAYFYNSPNCSSFRYRAMNMVDVLNNYGQDHVSAGYFFLNEVDYLLNVLDSVDLLVVCRSGISAKLSELIYQSKRKGVKVFFDTDDLVFSTNKIVTIMDSLNIDADTEVNLDYWYAYVGRISETLASCDSAIATNRQLADQLADNFSTPVAIVPNFMNVEQEQYSLELLSSPKPARECFRVGYFSGSPSHARDFQIVHEALASFMEKHEDVVLVIAGYIEAPACLEKFSDRIDYLPFTDFVNLQKNIYDVDLNIVPLQINEFTRCKSNLKYFEASFVKTVTLATDIPAYAEYINNGRNGFLTRNDKWDSSLEKVYHFHRDGLSSPIVEQAHKECFELFSNTKQYQRIVNALL